jgi:hypothetical protein
LIGAGHHKVKIGIGLSHLGEGFDKQIAALLSVNTAKEEKKSLAANLGALGEERVLQSLRGLGWWAARAVRNDVWIPAVQPEALLRETLLSAAGEQNPVGVAQDTILGRNPVEPLLDVLQRKGVFEVRVEHAVGEDHVRSIAGESTPGRETAVLPQPVHDYAIEPVAVRYQPGKQFRVEAVLCARRPQGMNRKANVLEERRGGIIKRHYLAGIADGAIAQQHADRLRGAACLRAQGSDNVQNPHSAFNFRHRA